MFDVLDWRTRYVERNNHTRLMRPRGAAQRSRMHDSTAAADALCVAETRKTNHDIIPPEECSHAKMMRVAREARGPRVPRVIQTSAADPRLYAYALCSAYRC